MNLSEKARELADMVGSIVIDENLPLEVLENVADLLKEDCKQIRQDISDIKEEQQAIKRLEVGTVVVISDEEIKAIEKAVQEETAPQECEDCFVFPDSKDQTIVIMPVVHGAFLRLNKSKAMVLAAIIQDCAHKL